MTRPTGVGLFNYDPPGTGFGGIDARAVHPDSWRNARVCG